MKALYEVRHAGLILEGEASSPQNACRKAFRTLIREGKIKRQPDFDPDSLSTFKDTTVRKLNVG